jgi:hypothetical protein
MKIIDKTPLLDSKGQLSLVARLQGSLTHGFNWPAELEAQSKVIAQLERVLEKGFVLIRNYTLPGSEIVIPMILVGTNGVTVLYVTNVKGFYEAKGDQWNTVVNGRAQPARINLLTRVIRYARAVQVFLERQGVTLPAAVEGVLITADPGAHVESMRPIARVVMSDAVKPFANSLLQAQAVWRADLVYDFADRIVNPRPPQEVAPEAPPVPATPAARAQAIFTASEQVKPFDTNDLGFAFEENAPPMEIAEGVQPVAVPAAAAGRGRIFGMTTSQVLILGILLLCEICIVIGFAGLMLTNR